MFSSVEDLRAGLHSSNTDTKSAQDILLRIDPNFSRAVGILNKYLPDSDSPGFANDYNQNKALGPDSEINSLSQVNTVATEGHSRPVDFDQRGGSTMSDLHNTEYLDDSRASRSKMSQNAKSPSLKGGVEISPAPKGAVRSGKTTEDSDALATVQQGSVNANSQRSGRTETPRPTPMPPKRTTESATAGPTQTSYNSSSEETESETSSRSLPFTAPDPSANRDLENASPKTMALCNRHPVHYCFFVYFPPATVDEDLMPFRRKAFMDKVARLQNPEHIREVKSTKCARDAFADRRIKSIERQSGTQIRLGELTPETAFIKGLPRRRLTIAGPSFAHVGCALNLFESLLPNVIRAAIFPYRLPEGASTRFAAGTRQSSAHQWANGRTDGTVLLRPQLDDKGGWRSFLPATRNETV